MLKINYHLEPLHLRTKIQKFWRLSAQKILDIEENYDASKGSPVFTSRGKYTTRGWTEWTQGFQWGSAILQYDATGEPEFLEIGRRNTIKKMAPHLTHFGVHDHGFNNISTYGNLLRLIAEGKIQQNDWERNFYELALRCSAAVQAKRWTKTSDGGGFIYSFNGPHSLFADTIRSLRILSLGYHLGHELIEDNDKKVNLLERLIHHVQSTANYAVYYGEGRDEYDIRGRVAHESIFNVNDGKYCCPNSQQGYSPFSTWTRGLAWIMCGYTEQIEYLDTLEQDELILFGGKEFLESLMLKVAQATCDFYIEQTPTDGIPYWDTGAPFLHKLGDYLDKPADPYNDYEPVDSSAAAIAAQGLLRLGHYLSERGKSDEGRRYWQAGLTVLNSLLGSSYLSQDDSHQGLVLHSTYHRPNGWDAVVPEQKIPNGESSMWGDYHMREAVLYIQRMSRNEPYLVFWS